MAEEDKKEKTEKEEISEKVDSTGKEKSGKKKYTDVLRENPWVATTIVLGILSFILIVGNFGMTGKVISENNAGEGLVNYLSSLGYEGFEVLSIEDLGTIYQVNMSYQGSEIPFYITKEGYIIGNSLVSIVPEEEIEEEETQGDIKSNKPVVELFVMSYCPYGTQAEKGILPVAELLGDKIEFRIRYVDYLMHGEKEAEENLREYCIQEIASTEEFIDYMKCFLEGDGVESSGGYILNGNDVNTCLSEAGINTNALENCITETDEEFLITENLNSGDTYPKFNVDTDLNEEYGVGGSPTLVINGVAVSSSRDPASYLDAVCSAFNDAPEECETELSSETPSPYFGWEGTGSSTSAQC